MNKRLLSVALALGAIVATSAVTTRAANGVPDVPVASAGDAITRGGAARGLVKELVAKMVENLIVSGLTAIHDDDGGDGVTGFLLLLLDGPTGSKLDEILENQEKELAAIAATQVQIQNLQDSLNTFVVDTQASFTKIEGEIESAEFTALVSDINGYATILNGYNGLNSKYQAAITACYVGGQPKTQEQLTTADRAKIQSFISAVQQADLPTMLNGITTRTDPLLGDRLYDVAASSLQLASPFEHQIYGDMYNIFNLITSLRTTALSLYKEYCTYNWGRSTDRANGVDLTTYLTTCGFADLNNEVIQNINDDVANNVILQKMDGLVTNAVPPPAADTEPIVTILQQINVHQAFDYYGAHYGDVYKLTSNVDGREYLILKSPGMLSLIVTTDSAGKARSYSYYTTNTVTLNHRYQLARTTADINGLFQRASGNPLQFLISQNDLTDISNTTDGIVLSHTTAVTRKPGVIKDDSYTTDYHALSLVNINHYAVDTDATNDYMTLTRNYTTGTSVTNVTDEDVGTGVTYQFIPGNAAKALNVATFLSIYYDTHIALAPTVAVDPVTKLTTYTYTPKVAADLQDTFSLDTGDVLDLSRLGGTGVSLPRTIIISGDATIRGGGASKPLADLKIEMYGSTHLTINNLHISAAASASLIRPMGTGDITLTVLGDNRLTGSSANADTTSGVIYAQMVNSMTITGSGTLLVENTSTGAAIYAGGPLSVSNAANLMVSTKGPSSINATTLTGNSSTITSTVALARGLELRSGGLGTFTNCALTLTFGVLNTQFSLVNSTIAYSNTTDVWAHGQVTTANVSGTGNPGNVYLAVIHDGGKWTGWQNLVTNDNLLNFQQGKTATFGVNFGAVEKIIHIEGIKLKSDQSGNPGASWTSWKVDDVQVTIDKNYVPLRVEVQPQMWFKDTGEKFFGLTAGNTGEFEVTVKTQDKTSAGTDSDIYLRINGSDGVTEYQNIKNIPNHDAFERGDTDTFRMAFSCVPSAGVTRGIGTPTGVDMYLVDHGSGPGWDCASVAVAPIVNGVATTLYSFAKNENYDLHAPDQVDEGGLDAHVAPWYPYIDLFHIPGHDDLAQYKVEIRRGTDGVLAAIVRQQALVHPLDYLNAGSSGLLPGTYNVSVSKLVEGSYALQEIVPLVVDYGAAAVVNVIPEPELDHGTYTFYFDLVNASGYDLEIKRNGVTVQDFNVVFRPNAYGLLLSNQKVAKGGVILSEPGTYQWIVHPLNPLTTVANTVGASSIFTVAKALSPSADFTVTPAVYSNLYPTGVLGTAVNGVLPVTFTWDAVAGAKDYFLYVSTAGGEVVLNRAKVEGDTVYGPVNLPANGYSWNVIATNATGVAKWSDAVSFLIRTDLQANHTTPMISHLLPANDAERAPSPLQVEFVITWDVAGDQQELWLYREDTGETYTDSSAVVLLPHTKTSLITVTAANFLTPGTYYWQVRGVNGTSQGQWSEARAYTILPAAGELGKPLLTVMHGADITVEFPVGTAEPKDVQFDAVLKLNGVFTPLTLAPLPRARLVSLSWDAWVAGNARLGTAAATVFVRARGATDTATGPWSDWASYMNP